MKARQLFALALALVAIAATIAGCGSGGSSSSSKATNVASNRASNGGPSPARRAALRACLAKQGITLPQRPPGQGGPLSGPPGGGPGGPGGFRRDPRLRAALQRCGAGRDFGGRFRRNNPAFRRMLASFAACMRSNGVNLPPPNTSRRGPIFNTRGIDTRSPRFQAAYAKCRASLRRGPAGNA